MNRRGTAAVLAMIFVVVFGVIAAGFYSLVTSSVTVTSNERTGQRAQAAAESGLAFVKHVVSKCKVRDTVVGTASNADEVYSQLRVLLPDGCSTFGVGKLDHDPGATVIAVPSVALFPGSAESFSATITAIPDSSLPKPRLRVSVTGSSGSAGLSRSLTVDLKPVELNFFNAGVKTRGRIDLIDGKSNIIGDPDSAASILSAYVSTKANDAAVLMKGGTVEGTIGVVSSPSLGFYSGSSDSKVDGMSAADALTHGGILQVDAPDFPEYTYDTLNYGSLLTNFTGGTLNNNASNVYIKGDTHVTGNTTLTGIIRVAKGVQLDIGGNVVIDGVIVCDGDDPTNNDVDAQKTKISFTGTPTFGAIQWVGNVPAAVQTALSGYSILGPNAYIYIQGNSGGSTNPNGNNKTGFAQNVVAGRLEEYGSGLVPIRDGSLMTMLEWHAGYSAYMDGDGVIINRTSNYKPPEGGYIKKYVWLADTSTYKEGN